MTPATRSPHRDRGMSESLQWTVLAPLLLLMVLGAIQAGIVLHGRTVATHAALAGAEAQAVAGAGVGTGERVAREVAERGGLRSVAVAVTRGQEVEVRVTGRVDSFVDIGAGAVDARATLPVEEVR